jgi:hypothetical protein
MEQPQIDQSLSVERLTPADLIAAAQAVATILAFRHASAPGAFPLSPEYPNFLAPGQVPFNLTVRWDVDPAGDRWTIALSDATVGLEYAAATAAAERLLQPILQLMRPRVLRYFFRSRVDELTPEDWNAIENSGVADMVPTGSDYEPRWVEDRTVLRVSPGTCTAALEEARFVLSDIRRRLDGDPPPT